MIVVEDSNSSERAPLKSNPDPPTHGGAPSQAPPPTYAAATTVVEQYRSVRAGPLSPPVAVLVVERESTLRRFLKAFGVALLIIFLWSMFIDSVDMAIGRRHKHTGGSSTYEDKENGLEWLIRDWYKTAPASTPCLCSQTGISTTEVVRALPIQYPPTSSPQVELALPTVSQPCASVAPTSVPQES